MMNAQAVTRAAAVFGLAGLAGLAMAALAAEPATIAPPAGRTPAISLGPKLLPLEQAGIGRQMPAIDLQGIDGRRHRLFEQPATAGTVVVVRDPDCPVSRQYGPRISGLADQFVPAGFQFVFIYPNVELNAEQRARDAAALGVPGVYAERGSFTLAEHLGVTSTGDVFVLDADHRLRYRGAVDDQFGIGYTRDVPMAHYLRNALDALREGRAIAVPATSAPGCYIDADPDHDQHLGPLPPGHVLSMVSATSG